MPEMNRYRITLGNSESDFVQEVRVTCHEPYAEVICRHLEGWNVAFHIWMQSNGEENKIPFKKAVREAYATQGAFLIALFELCKQAHSFCDKALPCPYPNARKWFFSILDEIVEWQIKDTLRGGCPVKGFSKKSNDLPLTKSQKEAALTTMHTVHQDLKNWENPFSRELQPHEWLLTEFCIQYPQVTNTHFRKFVKAYGAWVRQQDRAPRYGAIQIEGNAIYTTAGKGRGRRQVPKIHSSNFLKARKA